MNYGSGVEAKNTFHNNTLVVIDSALAHCLAQRVIKMVGGKYGC